MTNSNDNNALPEKTINRSPNNKPNDTNKEFHIVKNNNNNGQAALLESLHYEPVFFVGKVVTGFGRGSKDLGCPTSNMDNSSVLDIPNGIYCGLAQLCIQDQSQVQEDPSSPDAYKQVLGELPKVFPVEPMVCSYGYNPQYGNKERVLEVHILSDFNFNFYGATLRVILCKWMRDELKFNNLDELKQAIESDKVNARRECTSFKHFESDVFYFLKCDKTVTK